MYIIRLEETKSTNSYAKLRIKDLKDRTSIVARRQTSGRGRFSRSWVDLGGDNLFLTIILKPSDTFNDVYPNLTQYMSVVLCEIFEQYGISPEIKWPNDVQINGRKIAGILSETVMSGSCLEGIVLGVGVNLNSTKENLSKIQDKAATSLNLECCRDINLEMFLNQLLTKFFEEYDEFLKNGFEYIKNDYIKRNCFLSKELSVKGFNSITTGFAKCVNNRGELVLQTDDNKETVLTIGDIL